MLLNPLNTFLSPSLLGIAFGYVVQRGFFCLNSGTADFLNKKESSKFNAFLLAIALQSVSLSLLFFLLPSWIPKSDFYPFRALLGGLIFGFSMYYAGGCASGIWFKIGEGKLGALLAIGGLMTGLVLTPKFATAPLFNFLNTGNTYLGNLYLLTRYASMIAMTLGLSLWLVLIRTPNSCPKSSSVSWKTTGSMLALISLLAWISSQLAGRAYGMGIIGGTLDLYQSVVTHSLPSIPWEMLFVLGIPVGSYLSAYKDHKFKIQAPAMNKLHRPILGGLGMGLGASIAGGCTVGYGIVGIPIFSFAGLTTFAAIVMGVQLRILLNQRLP